jgi:hypothetical protein
MLDPPLLLLRGALMKLLSISRNQTFQNTLNYFDNMYVMFPAILLQLTVHSPSPFCDFFDLVDWRFYMFFFLGNRWWSTSVVKSRDYHVVHAIQTGTCVEITQSHYGTEDKVQFIIERCWGRSCSLYHRTTAVYTTVLYPFYIRPRLGSIWADPWIYVFSLFHANLSCNDRPFSNYYMMYFAEKFVIYI